MSIRINVGATFDGRDLQRAQRELDALKAQTETLSTKLANVGSRFQDFGGKVASVGSSLTRKLTLPLAAAGGASVAAAADFETSFSQIEGLVGVTGSDLDMLKDAAAALGPEFGASANEAAEAMFFITSAGIRGAEAVDVLEASLKGAAVGLGDSATIADLATSAMNAYGADVLGAADATDVLTAAVREGKLEPSELAGAMGQTLPVASAMGVGFDEVGAAFAAMSRTGTGASEAATQLRSIMTGLLKPSVEAEQALAEMGTSSEELRTQMREEGLLATLQNLTGMFEENEVGAEKVFGNVRALSGVLDLMGSNAQGTADIFEAMADTTGTLDDAFEVTAETSGFQFQQTMGELKAILLDVGGIVMPFVRDFVGGFQQLIDQFKALDEDQKRQIVQWAAIAAAIGPVLIILGKLVAAFGSAIKIVVGLAKGITLLFTPMGAIVAAIAAVIAIGVLLWKNWDTVQQKAGELWAAVSEWFGKLTADVIALLIGFIEWVSASWAGLKIAVVTAVQEMWLQVSGFFRRLAEDISAAVTAVWTLLSESWNAIVETVVGFARGMWEQLVEVFVGIKESLAGIMDDLLEGFGAVWEGLVGVVKAAANTIVGFVNSIMGAVEAFINFLARGINAIPSFTVPDWVPGIGGKTFGIKKVPSVSFPRIPLLADGGVVKAATLAVVGEAGPEVVVPLDRAEEFFAPAVASPRPGPTVINVSVASADPEAVVEAIRRYTSANGPLSQVVSV